MQAVAIADPLGALAPLMRVVPELESLCRFGAQWAARHEAEPEGWIPFHIVTRGASAIELVGRGRVLALGAGDIAVLPRPIPHIVRSPPAAAGGAAAPIRTLDGGPIRIKTNTAGEPETELICGRLRFETAGENLLRAALPDAIVVATADGPDAARLYRIVSAMKDELTADRPGARVIATDLASALLMMVVRVHLERGEPDGGLLRLLGHRQAARPVQAMLADPARPWTLDELAARALVSRASLVRLFRRLAGMAPLEFLSELRLELARGRLVAGAPVAEIAAEVGYRSESAFSRAFQRRFGRRPGELRAGRD